MKDLINIAANNMWTLMCLCSIAIDLRHRFPERLVNACRKVFFNLRPFFPLLIVAMHATSPLGGWQWVFSAVNTTVWLVMRLKKDDDDRWKRRRKKLAEKVQRQGTRLVVVPAGGSS